MRGRVSKKADTPPLAVYTNLVFETDELKNAILFSEINPTRKVFLVDVQVQTANYKVVAYKVIALHEIIDLED